MLRPDASSSPTTGIRPGPCGQQADADGVPCASPPVIPLLFRLHHAMMRVADRLAAPIGLTGSRWMTLCVLAEEGRPLTQSELGDRMLLSPQNVSRMIQTLEAEGLVTRRSRPGAGRSVFVELTPAGVDRRNQAKQLGDAFLTNFLIGFGEPRVELLESDLRTLIENVIAYEARLISGDRPEPTGPLGPPEARSQPTPTNPPSQ